MADRQDGGGRQPGKDRQGQGRPDAGAEQDRKREGGQSGGAASEEDIRTPGGNLRYGGGNAQGIPMVPDGEESK